MGGLRQLHDCTVFGGYAEHLADHLSKGAKVAVAGKLRWSQWERDGQKRSKVEVVADSVEYMVNSQPPAGGTEQQHCAQPGQQQIPRIDPASAVYDDDIPF